MKNVLFLLLVLFPLDLLAEEENEARKNLKAYPAAEAGMKRVVIELPKEETEEDLKVELMVGKVVEVDAVNRYFFGGMLKEETLEGWGFSKYVLKQLGPMAGTRIGVPPGEPKVKRFIALGGGEFLLRYNSRLPLVVYVPEEVEVRWRLWKALEPKGF